LKSFAGQRAFGSFKIFDYTISARFLCWRGSRLTSGLSAGGRGVQPSPVTDIGATAKVFWMPGIFSTAAGLHPRGFLDPGASGWVHVLPREKNDQFELEDGAKHDRQLSRGL